jgi:hypothetical protein
MRSGQVEHVVIAQHLHLGCPRLLKQHHAHTNRTSQQWERRLISVTHAHELINLSIAVQHAQNRIIPRCVITQDMQAGSWVDLGTTTI